MSRFIILLPFILLACGGEETPKVPEYVIYHDHIVRSQKRVSSDMLALINGVAISPIEEIDGSYLQICTEVDSTRKFIQGFKGSFGDSVFYFSSRDLFTFYDSICDNQLKGIRDHCIELNDEQPVNFEFVDYMKQQILSGEEALHNAFVEAHEKFGQASK